MNIFEKILERLRNSVDKECVSSVPKVRLCDAIQIVQEVAEEYNNGWIACSERLPENIYTVVIYVKDIKRPTFGWYSNIVGWNLVEKDLELKDFTVIAWQPLPEPFKERD